MRENNFYIFIPSDFDLWPLEFRPQICSLVTPVQDDVLTKLELVFPVFEKIGGTRRTDGTDRRTDGQTDRVQLLKLPVEGRTFYHLPRYIRYMTDGHMPQKRSIFAGEIYSTVDDMSRKSRWSFWSWFDV